MAVLFEFVAEGAPVFVLGGGDNRYQFVHADDLADACLRAADRPGAGDLQHRRAPSSARCARRSQALVDHAGTGSRVRSLPVGAGAARRCSALATVGLAPFAPYHWLLYGESLWFDTTEAQTELGWEPAALERVDGDRVVRVVPRAPRTSSRARRIAPPVAGPPRPAAGAEASALSVVTYLAGSAAVIAVAATLGWGAWRLRSALLPQWSGPPARLAEIVMAVAVPVGLGQLLGSFGAFRRFPMLIGCLPVGAAMGLVAQRFGVAGPGLSRPSDAKTRGEPRRRGDRGGAGGGAGRRRSGSATSRRRGAGA